MTTISRAALLDKMAMVEPALAKADFVPVMSRYWFTGTELLACSDQVSVRTACETPWVGAAPRHLADLLRASRARDLSPESGSDGHLTLTAARARIKVELTPPDQYQVFADAVPRPDPTRDLGTPIADLRAALQHAARSNSQDTSRAEHLGVTLVRDGDAILFFGTDGKTIARAAVVVASETQLDRQVILPRAFVDLAARLLRDARSAAFEVGDGGALLAADSTVLHGRLIESENPLAFEAVVAQYWPEGGWDALVPVPPTLALVVARAAVIADTKATRVHADIKIRGGRMEVRSSSERGEVRDTLATAGHPDADCRVDPVALREGLEGHDRLLFTPRCCVLGHAESGNIYLVVARSE